MTTDPPATSFECVVCHELAPARTLSECNGCNGRYHLNQRNDTEGKDCGTVWIDEQYLALQFACNNCLPAETPDDGAPASVQTSPAPQPSPRERTPRVRRYKRRA